MRRMGEGAWAYVLCLNHTRWVTGYQQLTCHSPTLPTSFMFKTFEVGTIVYPYLFGSGSEVIGFQLLLMPELQCIPRYYPVVVQCTYASRYIHIPCSVDPQPWIRWCPQLTGMGAVCLQTTRSVTLATPYVLPMTPSLARPSCSGSWWTSGQILCP